MSLLKTLGKFADTLLGTAVLLARDNLVDVAMAITMPQVNTKLQSMFPVARPQSPFLSQRMAARTVDGAILEGSQGWQKLAIRKGLPDPTTKDKRLGVENDPHVADGFDGEILAGYGKGRKTLLADEVVITKVAGKTSFARMNYHEHDADRAGLHYDLVVEGIQPGTPKWEMNVPRGPMKGRYAFIQTPRGMLINLMRDHGEQFTRPTMTLKDELYLETVDANRDMYHVSRKLDGSSAAATIHNNRVYFRSHRDGGQTYFDRLPELEHLENKAPFWLYRKTFPAPNQNGTKLIGELVHRDGAARQGGIVNALPQKAVQIQIARGSSHYHAWDIDRYRGRDIQHLTFEERLPYMRRAVEEIRLYNRYYHVAEECPEFLPASVFYQYVITADLPEGEGIVVKRLDQVERRWPKIKCDEDPLDVHVIEFIEGNGKYAGSLGSLVVETDDGVQSKVGSFRCTDEQRQWTWDHQDLLRGEVAEIEAFELTASGHIRAGRFKQFHPSKSEASLIMYAETLAGGDQDEMLRTKYRLINAHH
jgi:hypothetical protein